MQEVHFTQARPIKDAAIGEAAKPEAAKFLASDKDRLSAHSHITSEVRPCPYVDLGNGWRGGRKMAGLMLSSPDGSSKSHGHGNGPCKFHSCISQHCIFSRLQSGYAHHGHHKPWAPGRFSPQCHLPLGKPNACGVRRLRRNRKGHCLHWPCAVAQPSSHPQCPPLLPASALHPQQEASASKGGWPCPWGFRPIDKKGVRCIMHFPISVHTGWKGGQEIRLPAFTTTMEAIPNSGQTNQNLTCASHSLNIAERSPSKYQS